MTRAAVLDLGSNSFHLLVADVDGPHVAAVDRAREMLHLGRELELTGTLGEHVVRRAVVTVERHRAAARRAGAEDIVVVATAALREPAAAGLLARLSEVLGDAPTVLHGQEEARLAYLGARAAVPTRAEPTLVLDLGGGSMELAVGTASHVTASASVALGAGRLAALVPDDPATTTSLAALDARIDDELASVVPGLLRHVPSDVIAVGGTVRALARHLAARAGRWLPTSVNLAPLDRDELASATATLVALDTAGRGRLPGVSSRRADHLHIAAVVLDRTLRALGDRSAVVSDWGLREGVLLDRFGDVGGIDVGERRQHDVERLVAASGVDPTCSRRVADIAVRLFDATSDGLGRHAADRGADGADGTERELLAVAARLHDIGAALPLRRAHEHGAYVVEHAELRGFTPRELAIVLTLVRFLPSRGISRRYPPFAALDADDRRTVERLLALLRIAVTLASPGSTEVVALRTIGATLEATMRGPESVLTDVVRALADDGPSVHEALDLEVHVRTAPGARDRMSGRVDGATSPSSD